MHVYMHACMHVCMYACMYVYTHLLPYIRPLSPARAREAAEAWRKAAETTRRAAGGCFPRRSSFSALFPHWRGGGEETQKDEEEKGEEEEKGGGGVASYSHRRRLGGPRIVGLSPQRLMAPSFRSRGSSVASSAHRVSLDGRISRRLDGARPGDDLRGVNVRIGFSEDRLE